MCPGAGSTWLSCGARAPAFPVVFPGRAEFLDSNCPLDPGLAKRPQLPALLVLGFCLKLISLSELLVEILSLMAH